MKPIGHRYHLWIDEEANWKIMMGDTELFFDPEYRAEYNTIQWGYVDAAPYKYYQSQEQFGPLAGVGNKVYFHHFVHNADNLCTVSKVVDGQRDFYFAEPQQLYCEVRDGEIHMLNDNVLVEPIMEDESNYQTDSGIMTKPNAEAVKNIGIIRHVPDHAELCGIKPGDKIFYITNSDYKLEVEGKEYYCMQLHRDIPYKFNEDGSITMLTKWGVVEPLDEEKDFEQTNSGLFLMRKDYVQKHKGRVSHINGDCEVVPGEEVIFDRKQFHATEIDGKRHYCVDIKRDIFLTYAN